MDATGRRPEEWACRMGLVYLVKTPTVRHLTLSLNLIFFLAVSHAQRLYTLTFKDARFNYILTADSLVSPDSVNYDCVIKKIQIADRKSNRVLQVITPPENNPPADVSLAELFIIEDMNFDRVNDIRLMRFMPAAPNTPYYCWTYDTVVRRFVRNRVLEEITSPRFDPKAKRIYSFWRGSCCDHGLSTYKYINGRPVKIEEWEEAMDGSDTSRYITTEKKLVKGQWKVKRTVVIGGQ